MKKLLILCMTAVLCLCCLSSCSLFTHKNNQWFSEEKLAECLVSDMPRLDCDYVKESDKIIYANLSEAEFDDYLNELYGYLKDKNFKHLGTRGEVASSLSGAFVTYYFEPETELSEFNIFSNTYKFVYSDGKISMSSEDDDFTFCILTIGRYESTQTVEYGIRKFDYNTQISLKFNSEAPLSGRYTLKDNYYIRDQAGAEWLCEITSDDIAEIKMISGGGGPLPPVSFTHISSSKNKAVISNILEEYYWLDSKPVSEERTQIADGGYFVVQFILNNGEVKRLYFINGDFYHDGNGNYFELVRLPVFRDGTNFVNHYGFEEWRRYCQVYLTDETLVCEIPVSELEFEELTDDIYLGDTAPTRYIIMNREKIYFIKDSYFYIGDDRSVYYQLVGKNLDELIAEYSATATD